MVLPELPENCKAIVISFTSPQDACRLSSVSRNFKSAAESDPVWGKFLPPETATILSQSSAPELANRSKKEIYCTLCHNPVLIHRGRMVNSLHPLSPDLLLTIIEINWNTKNTPIYSRSLKLNLRNYEFVILIVNIFGFNLWCLCLY